MVRVHQYHYVQSGVCTLKLVLEARNVWPYKPLTNVQVNSYEHRNLYFIKRCMDPHLVSQPRTSYSTRKQEK